MPTKFEFGSSDAYLEWKKEIMSLVEIIFANNLLNSEDWMFF